jgi:hypothetical protein
LRTAQITLFPDFLITLVYVSEIPAGEVVLNPGDA